MRRLISMLLLFLCVPSPAIACGHGTGHPLDVPANAAFELLKARDFKALDALVVRYRDPKSLASNGQRNLTGMYNGLSKHDARCNGDDNDTGWAELGELLTAWQAASTRSTAPALAITSFEMSLAWHARSGGYADTVSDAQWAEMRKHVKQAQDLLDAMPRKARDDPQWYRVQLEVALAASWDQAKFEKVFREGVKKFPDFYSLYSAKAEYLSPRWFGSEERLSDFIEQSAQRKDIGPMLYNRLLIAHWRSGQFKDGSANWPRMRAAFETMLKAHPNDWDRNEYAQFACFARDAETAARQFGLIGDRIVMPVWSNEPDEIMKCKAMGEGKQCFRREDNHELFCR